MHSDRRQRQCCLCSCLQRGHVRYIGFMHSYLGEQELSQPSDNVGSSPPASTPYDQTKNCPPGVCLSSRVGAHRQCGCRPQLGMFVWSAVNGCLPSWPNFVFVHSLSLLPFSPFALKHRERKTGYLQDATQRRSQTNTCSASRRGCAAFDYLNRRSKASGSNCSRDSTTTSA